MEKADKFTRWSPGLPRFLIQAQRGTEPLAPESITLPDIAAARREAVCYAGELLREEADRLQSSGEWTITVADETALTLFSITLLWTGAPALSPPTARPSPEVKKRK